MSSDLARMRYIIHQYHHYRVNRSFIVQLRLQNGSLCSNRNSSRKIRSLIKNSSGIQENLLPPAEFLLPSYIVQVYPSTSSNHRVIKMTKREVKLVTTKDWDLWTAMVKCKAVAYGVWDSIDPTKDTKPVEALKPYPPILLAAEDETEAPSAVAIARYNAAQTIYKPTLREWKNRTNPNSKLMDFIYNTVSVANATHIQKIEVHPWDLLRALK